MHKHESYRDKDEFAHDLDGVYEAADRQKVTKIWEDRAHKYGVELPEREDRSLVDYLWELRALVRAAYNQAVNETVVKN